MAQVWFSRPHQLFWLTPSLVRWWSHPSDWKACLVSHASYNRRLIGLFGRLSIRKTFFFKMGLLSLFLSKPPLALNWLAPFCLSFFIWAAALNHLMSALCIHRCPSSTLQLVTRDTSTLTPLRIEKNKNKQEKRKFIMLTSLTHNSDQGCISCGILVSGIWARGISSEHMENMEMFSCSPT